MSTLHTLNIVDNYKERNNRRAKGIHTTNDIKKLITGIKIWIGICHI